LPSGTSYPVAAFDLTIAAHIAKLLASHTVIQAIIPPSPHPVAHLKNNFCTEVMHQSSTETIDCSDWILLCKNMHITKMIS
jgi:hypothetical protein